MKKFIPFIVIAITLIIGVVLLIVGIKGTIQLNEKKKEFVQVEGQFVDYEVYSHGTGKKNRTTYRLIYEYTVDENRYIIATDYGTSNVPKKGSSRTVLYNPENPEDAMLDGFNQYTVFLMVGGIFTVVSLVFVFVFISIARVWFLRRR